MSEAFDLEDFLGGETVARIEFKDRTVLHHFREIDNKTDLEYQRRLTKIRTSARGAKKDAVEYSSPDEALLLEIWLYGQLVTKVEVEVVAKVPGDKQGETPSSSPPLQGATPSSSPPWQGGDTEGVDLVDVPDFQNKISPPHKRAAVAVYNERVQRAPEAAERKNS